MPEHPERPVGGSGDVHSRMSTTGGRHEELDITYTPDREVSGLEQARDQAQGMMDQAKDRAQDIASQARDRAQDLGERASDTMNRAKNRLKGAGVLDTVRDHPLPALGAAFALGFVLAGSGSRHERKRGAMSMMRRQVRSAVMGGVTAALANEARSMLGVQGEGGGMLGSLFGGMEGGSRGRSGSSSQRSQSQQFH